MILLWILKVLSLILLCILALALLAALVVLSAPVRYRVNAGYDGKTDILLNAQWILRIFTVNYNASGTPAFTFKICGRVRQRRKLQKAGKVKKKKKQDEDIDLETDVIEHKKHKKKVSFTEKAIKVKENWDKLIDYPYKHMIVEKTILLLKRLVKAILPKDITGECRFGFEDPCITGMLLGAFYALFGMLRLYNQIYVSADFEKEYLYLKCQIAGKIRLWSLLWPLIAYAVSKPVWIILKPLVFKKRAKG